MFGIALVLAWASGEIFMLVSIYRSWMWHHRGDGARKAHAEYARIRAEQPDIAEARLTESEFVHYYVAARPGMTPYIVAALVLLLIGLFVARVINRMG